MCKHPSKFIVFAICALCSISTLTSCSAIKQDTEYSSMDASEIVEEKHTASKTEHQDILQTDVAENETSSRFDSVDTSLHSDSIKTVSESTTDTIISFDSILKEFGYADQYIVDNYDAVKERLSQEFNPSDTPLLTDAISGVKAEQSYEILFETNENTYLVRDVYEKLYTVQKFPYILPKATYSSYEHYNYEALIDNFFGKDYCFPVNEKYKSQILYQGIFLCEVPVGEPIYAPTNGTVMFSDFFSEYGKTILLDCGDDKFCLLFHCNDLLVNAGDKVEKGQVIAHSGSSGHTSNPAIGFRLLVL